MSRPTMFMIAGPNGAGKSTLYKTVIQPRVDAPFINADIIQRDELKDPSMEASYAAAKIAETRRRESLANGRDFVSESTFSHPSKLALIEEAKAAGFHVVMYHVNVRSADLSVHRVANRVLEGEHNVPEEKIRERYVRNQSLIRQAVLQSDRAYVYDNSRLNEPPCRALDFTKGALVRVGDRVPDWAKTLYSAELEKFSENKIAAPVSNIEKKLETSGLSDRQRELVMARVRQNLEANPAGNLTANQTATPAAKSAAKFAAHQNLNPGADLARREPGSAPREASKARDRDLEKSRDLEP